MRSAMLLLAWTISGVFAAGCGDREVELRLWAPNRCLPLATDDAALGDVDAGAAPNASACPLEGLQSIDVVVESNTGETVHEGCLSSPPDACSYADLHGFRFVEGLSPRAGLNIRLVGYTGPDCAGRQHFFCDSPGDHLVNLDSSEVPVDLFCSCAPVN